MLTPTKEERDPESNTDHHLISIDSRVPVRQDWKEDELENSRSTRHGVLTMATNLSAVYFHLNYRIKHNVLSW